MHDERQYEVSFNIVSKTLIFVFNFLRNKFECAFICQLILSQSKLTGVSWDLVQKGVICWDFSFDETMKS